MNYKNFIVKTNDFLVGLSFIILLIFCGIVATSGAVGSAIVTFVGGVIALSLVSGAWIVLSSILEESKKQTEILEQMLKGKG